MLAFVLVYEEDGNLEAIGLDRILQYSEMKAETEATNEPERSKSNRMLLMRWKNERNPHEVNVAVEKYNLRFNKNIATNVWLGRQFKDHFSLFDMETNED